MSWLPLVLLSLVAALLIAAPIIRKVRPALPREDYDLQVYRDQLRELEEDKERGLLSADQENSARLEIDRRLLGVSKTGYRKHGNLPLWQTALILAISVPAVSLSLYWWQGTPGALDQPLSERVDLVDPVQSREILALIAEQQAALAEDPANAEAWILLGRGYLVSGRFTDAADAFQRAIDLGEDGADTQMELFEALLNQTGGTITATSQRALSAALAADPLHPAVRFYQGVGRAQAGQMQEAFDIWFALAAETPPDAPWMAPLRRQLEGAAEELGINLEAVLPPPPGAGIAAMNPEEQKALIENMVGNLAARLEENPNDPEGWMRLAQSYGVLGRLEDAVIAIGRAAALRPDDATIMFQQAALLMDNTAEGEPFPAQVRANLDRVLDVEPANAQALFYAGLAAEADVDVFAARAFWQRLLDLLEPDGDAYAEIQARISTLGAK